MLVQHFRPSQWGVFAQSLQLLVEKSSIFRDSTVSPESLLQLVSDRCSAFGRELIFPGSHCRGVNSALWIPIDLYLEDCIDGSVAATSAIELLSGKDIVVHVTTGSSFILLNFHNE